MAWSEPPWLLLGAVLAAALLAHVRSVSRPAIRIAKSLVAGRARRLVGLVMWDPPKLVGLLL